jgi:hypothetical protein
MTHTNVIKMEDARELRELGLPILPVVDASFSKRAERLFIKADKAKAQFYFAFRDYSIATPPTERLFNRMKRALTKISILSAEVARFNSSQYGEAAALQALLTNPMKQFVVYWDGLLASLTEEGEEISVFITQEMLDGWDVPALPHSDDPAA